MIEKRDYMNENSKIRIEVTNDRKKEIITILIVFILAFLWIWYGVGVSDNGRGADSVRNELESAGEEQRSQAESLDRAEGANRNAQQSIRESQQSAGRIEERNTEIQNLERSDAELIEQCQQILKGIRERG